MLTKFYSLMIIQCTFLQINTKLKNNTTTNESIQTTSKNCEESIEDINSITDMIQSNSETDENFSKKLKRKFEELEVITERLRARLFDVTGNLDADLDDEFESDLNTIPDEDDDFEESNMASEMSLNWFEHCQNKAKENSADDIQETVEPLHSQLNICTSNDDVKPHCDE